MFFMQITAGSRTIILKTCRHLLCFECLKAMVATALPLGNIFYICSVPGCEKTIPKSKVRNVCIKVYHLKMLPDILPDQYYSSL